MNFNLNYEGFEKDLVLKQGLNGGIQYRFRFDNNYGASVVKSCMSYGYNDDLWELAVLKYNANNEDWNLVYDTEITDDVLGFLRDEDVRNLLGKIKEL